MLDIGVLAGYVLPMMVGCILDNIVEERQMELAKVGGLCGPVVHLNVNVGVNVAVPWGFSLVVPDALQIVGYVNATTAGNLKVPAVVEIELLEVQVVSFRTSTIVRRVVVSTDKLVCRHVGAFGCDAKLDAIGQSITSFTWSL